MSRKELNNLAISVYENLKPARVGTVFPGKGVYRDDEIKYMVIETFNAGYKLACKEFKIEL